MARSSTSSPALELGRRPLGRAAGHRPIGRVLPTKHLPATGAVATAWYPPDSGPYCPIRQTPFCNTENCTEGAGSPIVVRSSVTSKVPLRNPAATSPSMKAEPSAAWFRRTVRLFTSLNTASSSTTGAPEARPADRGGALGGVADTDGRCEAAIVGSSFVALQPARARARPAARATAARIWLTTPHDRCVPTTRTARLDA
jgi:hypothetical protein